jgi:aminoglycoside phosphotransferase family enzyme
MARESLSHICCAAREGNWLQYLLMNSLASELEPEAAVVRQPSLAQASPAQIELELIEAMKVSAFYPHPCQSVETVQTLTAWLLFAGDFVYKIRKPVCFSHLDARTPAKRYRLCLDEFHFNRRLAPEVYQGIAGIAARFGTYRLVPNAALNEPGVREFAVVMHHLPSDRMLSKMVAHGATSFHEIEQVAEKLAQFHRDCSISKSKTWGSAAALSRLVAGNVAEAEPLIADTIMRKRVLAAAGYLRAYVVNHHEFLDDRARNGRVRDDHGDLRADSIYLMPQALAIIGCLEHAERLRYCDVASNLASVMLDLEMAGRNDLSDWLLHSYRDASDDTELGGLIPFYKCYRAFRRGQLEMLTSLQTEMPHERRILARRYAGEWFQLAEHIASTNADQQP